MSQSENTFSREDNPRLIGRQEWWVAYAKQSTQENQTPICTECGEMLEDCLLTGLIVCDECAPYVPENERSLAGVAAMSTARHLP